MTGAEIPEFLKWVARVEKELAAWADRFDPARSFRPGGVAQTLDQASHSLRLAQDRAADYR